VKQAERSGGGGGGVGGWRALVQLPGGPLDLVGDVHGELEVLQSLMAHLGYGPDGDHPGGRTLVFLGDLIDRGPDSPGVVRLVSGLMDRGRAVTVMGNHDLNAAAGIPKADNTWLFGHGPIHESECGVSSERERSELLGFLNTLPIAARRDDLRVVHACWEDAGLDMLRGAAGPAAALSEHKARIASALPAEVDQTTRNLAHQNQNPVKLLTSGPEEIAPTPFFAGGKVRGEARSAWWDRFDSDPIVVFGHYWRIPIEVLQKDDGLFSKHPLDATLGKGKAMCIDYSVGGRAAERRAGNRHGPFLGRLAALRWPERELVFDNGERLPMTGPISSTGDLV